MEKFFQMPATWLPSITLPLMMQASMTAVLEIGSEKKSVELSGLMSQVAVVSELHDDWAVGAQICDLVTML